MDASEHFINITDYLPNWELIKEDILLYGPTIVGNGDYESGAYETLLDKVTKWELLMNQKAIYD